MAVIRLRPPTPLAERRRSEIGLAGLVALQRSLMSSGGPSLPADLVADETALRIAGTEVDEALARASALLRERGIVADDGPVDAVVANVAALTGSPRRLRVSLQGPAVAVLGHYWVDAAAGGSLVRDGERCALSLFDARELGSEVLGVLPDPADDGPPDRRREGFEAPIEALSVVGAVDDLPDDEVEVVAGLLDVDPHVAAMLRTWSERVQAVLHLTVLDTDPTALPGMLVWFLDQGGWWSARSLVRDGVRTIDVRPRRRDDLAAAVGDLVARAWAVAR